MVSAVYRPLYNQSRALIIGIDKYQHVSPLLHACNDAKGVAALLIERFKFDTDNIKLLLDTEATRESIMRAFLQFSDSSVVEEDDRVLVFFAGHGHTVTGRYGEIGYLVPADGRSEDLSSLVRWDDLTRNADLIPAKHMLFLMDACYGGLALKRTSRGAGSSRFLKDMLQRYSRQVLAAGKPDEPVSDSGGTRPGHSIFTSHLLDGMEGAASPAKGTLTGYGLMAYVYERVSKDPNSRQTPHFGFFDGDGDFIFDLSELDRLKAEAENEAKSLSRSEPEADLDVMIKTPAFSNPNNQDEPSTEYLKRLLTDPLAKIQLSDHITRLIRQAIESLRPDKFPTDSPLTDEEFATRVQAYEEAIADLQVAVILLAHWASESGHVRLLEKIITRIAEVEKPGSGFTVWVRLSWYPVLLLMYSAGIAALSAERYDTLNAALFAPVQNNNRRADSEPAVVPTIEALTEVVEQFKRLPDMANKYVPRSEHLFKKLQPPLEDLLFFGRKYEVLFDEFEILLALSFSDARDEDPKQHVWGPPGRFAWKERGRLRDDPVYTKFIQAAKRNGPHWRALEAGMFKGSEQRFREIADGYGQVLSQVNWW